MTANQDPLIAMDEYSDHIRVNLATIIGRDDADRIVSFQPMPEALGINEECGVRFGTDLTPDELDLLISWLQERRSHIRRAARTKP